jgi:hypothetical protein
MLTFFNFKRNIFERKVSERTLLKGWMSKVWILHFYSFLNEIFSAEKCPNIIIDMVWMARFGFWIYSFLLVFKRNIFGWKVSERMNRQGLNGKVCRFYSFLNEIFSAEKCPNGIIDKVWMSKVWILHFYWFLLIFKRNIFGWKVPERNNRQGLNGKVCRFYSFLLIFKRNIFERKVFERMNRQGKVCGFYSFLNGIFSSEKSPKWKSNRWLNAKFYRKVNIILQGDCNIILCVMWNIN